MPAEMLPKDTSAAPAPSSPEDELHEWARRHLERVRHMRFHIAAFALGMLVLTPIWLLVERQDNGSFERWSSNGNPGDWEPWILYVALAWGMFVAVTALRVHFDRPTTEAEIDRELRRLTSRHS